MKENYNCTFCGKHADNVVILVTSDSANICNECVEICSLIIEQKEESMTVKAQIK